VNLRTFNDFSICIESKKIQCDESKKIQCESRNLEILHWIYEDSMYTESQKIQCESKRVCIESKKIQCES